MSEVDAWLEERISRVPAGLAERLDRGEEAETIPTALLARGLGAVDGMGALAPGDREGAYRLLVADAYLTWACEAAAEAPDPGDVLEELLDRLGAGGA